jgi:hypothetical protein
MARMLRLTGKGPVRSIPVSVTPPVLSGTATVGQVLTCSTGEWWGGPTPTYSFQWVRGASTDVPGATSATKTVVAGDQTFTLKCRVTATNDAGSTTATSAATGTIA